MILGIDPGFRGALALLSRDDGKLQRIWEMPLNSFSSRPCVSGELLTDYLKPYVPRVKFAAIEFVAASPNMGVTSAFRFGEGFGVLKGVFAALHIPVRLIVPAVWKAELGLSRDKKLSIATAKMTFPGWAKEFERVSDDGKAEAALIAWYAWKKFCSLTAV